MACNCYRADHNCKECTAGRLPGDYKEIWMHGQPHLVLASPPRLPWTQTTYTNPNAPFAWVKLEPTTAADPDYCGA